MPHETNDGGQAFPQLNSTGMTLRDWFAGQAMASLYASGVEVDVEDADIAAVCWQLADAMIEARKE